MLAGVFLLPTAWQLLASFSLWASLVSSMAIVYARYGMHTCAPSSNSTQHASAGAWCLAHAPGPVDWAAVADALACDAIQRLLFRSFVGGVLLPLCVACAFAYGWGPVMQQRQSRRTAVSREAIAEAHGGPTDSSDNEQAASSSAAAPAAVEEPAAECSASAPAPSHLAASLMQQLHTSTPEDARAPKHTGGALYRSAIRHATVMAKVGAAEGQHDQVAAALPGILITALQNAGAASGVSGTQQPSLVSLAGWPGCWQGVGHVAWDHMPSEAYVAAAIQPLLPAGMRLLDVTVASLPAPGALPVPRPWCSPVALPASHGRAALSSAATTLHLPPGLVQRLAAPGHGLRVVVSAPGQLMPFSNVIMYPGQPGWAVESQLSQLQVDVPTGSAAALMTITLLDAAQCGPDEQGLLSQQAQPHVRADAVLASLPVLVLPAAACTELQGVWQAMVEHARQRLPSGCPEDVVAGDVFVSEWASVALDVALVLRIGAYTSAAEEVMAPVGHQVLAFLAQRGATACCEMIAGACVARRCAGGAACLLRGWGCLQANVPGGWRVHTPSSLLQVTTFTPASDRINTEPQQTNRGCAACPQAPTKVMSAQRSRPGQRRLLASRCRCVRCCLDLQAPAPKPAIRRGRRSSCWDGMGGCLRVTWCAYRCGWC